MIIDAASTLSSTISSHSFEVNTDNDDATSRLADNILRSTSTNIEITSELDVAGFLAMHTGQHLRLEMLGLIYALAGRACILGLARDFEKRDDFVQAMLHSSTACLQLARDIAPDVNDVMVWLAYEHLRLTTNIQGDSRKLQTQTMRSSHFEYLIIQQTLWHGEG